MWPLRGTPKLSLALQDCVPSTDDVFSNLQNETKTSGGELKTKGREVPPNRWEDVPCCVLRDIRKRDDIGETE